MILSRCTQKQVYFKSVWFCIYPVFCWTFLHFNICFVQNYRLFHQAKICFNGTYFDPNILFHSSVDIYTTSTILISPIWCCICELWQKHTQDSNRKAHALNSLFLFIPWKQPTPNIGSFTWSWSDFTTVWVTCLVFLPLKVNIKIFQLCTTIWLMC